MTRMHAGFTGVVQHELAAAARRGRAPSGSTRAASTRCPASARRSRSGCGRSASRPCATCCSTGHAVTRAPSTRSRSHSSGADDEVAIAGEVVDVRTRRLGGRRTIVTARIKDSSGAIGASWFNQPWLADKLTPGTQLRLRGKLGRYGFDVKSYDVGEARGDRRLRARLSGERTGAVDAAAGARCAARSPSTRATSRTRCRPSSSCRCAATRSRRSTSRATRPRPRRRGGGSRSTSCSRCSSSSRARATTTRSRRPSPQPGDLVARYREVLPFTLTEHQESAIAEIDVDLARTVPMQRLLQGDVGSGKTVVALYALLRAVENGAPGRADGADRDARRAALPDARAALRAARRALRPAHRDRSGRRRSATRSRTASRRSPSGRTH